MTRHAAIADLILRDVPLDELRALVEREVGARALHECRESPPVEFVYDLVGHLIRTGELDSVVNLLSLEHSSFQGQ